MSQNRNDWRAALDLAEAYGKKRRFEEAVSLLRPMMDANLPAGERGRRRRISLFFKYRIWRASDQLRAGERSAPLAELEKIIEETSTWQEQGEDRNLYALERCIATRRAAEGGWVDGATKFRRLGDALDTYGEVFRADGVQGFMVPDIISTLADYEFALGRAGEAARDTQKLEEFLEEFGADLVKGAGTDRQRLVDTLRKLERIEAVVLSGVSLAATPELPRALAEHGYQEAAVYSRANGRSYLFAEPTASSVQYYVPRSAALHYSDEEFDEWSKGTLLWVLPVGEEPEAGRAIRVVDVQRAES